MIVYLGLLVSAVSLVITEAIRDTDRRMKVREIVGSVLILAWACIVIIQAVKGEW